MPRVSLIATFLLVAGCEGRISFTRLRGADVPSDSGKGPGTDTSAAPLSNRDVFNRLKVTCGGCHTTDVRPFFADLQAFENLIAYEPKWVTPGDPATSGLIGLMTGVNATNRQMPPSPSDRFEVLDKQGNTKITLAEVKTWIRSLAPRSADAGTEFEPVEVRRKSAEQIRQTLYDQLGLSESDFVDTSYNGAVPYFAEAKAADSYAVRSSDSAPQQDPTGQAGTLYGALGGSHLLAGRPSNRSITPSMLSALVPISQAWCATAFEKPNNKAVLSKATLQDQSSTSEGAAAIRENLSNLYLRMLGEVAPADDLDDLYSSVFLAYEPQGAAVAWTAVCAALVRDPKWILY